MGSIRTAWLLFACLIASATADGAPASTCQQQDVKIKMLEKELAVAKEALAAAAGAAACPSDNEFSVLKMVTRTGSVATDTLRHLLNQTAVDDQVTEKLSGHAETLANFTSEAVSQLSSMDYAKLVDAVKNHELYGTYVGPTMDKVAQNAQPYVTQYVNPVLESASGYADAAKAYTTPAHEAISGAVPVLKKSATQALEYASDWRAGLADAEAKVEELMSPLLSPVFAFFSKVSPTNAHIFPQRTVDRVLFILLSILLLTYCYYVLKFSVRMSVKVCWRTFKIAFFATVRLPLKIARKVFFLWLYCITCCYCCGLFRKRGAKDAAKGKDKGAAKADAAKKTAEAGKKNNHPKATADDLRKLLEESNKKKKLAEAAKKLAGIAQKGVPMDGKEFPAHVQGKVIEKEVLKKVVQKFSPELDAKKLGL